MSTTYNHADSVAKTAAALKDATYSDLDAIRHSAVLMIREGRTEFAVLRDAVDEVRNSRVW